MLPEPPVTTNDSAEQASAPPRGIPFAYGVGRLENRASLQVDITTGTGYNSVHGGSVLSYLAPIREATRAPAPVALSNPREKIHGALDGSVVGAQPHVRLPLGVADLRRVLAPRLLPDAAVVRLHSLLIPSLDSNDSDSEVASSRPTVPEKIHL